MDKKLKIFLSVCYGISFIAGGVFHCLGGDLSTTLFFYFATAYMLIPTISVLITQKICGEKLFSDVGVNFKINKWWLIAWLLMPVINILAMLCSTLLPGVSLDPNSELVTMGIARHNDIQQYVCWSHYQCPFGFRRRNCMERFPSTYHV